ncbi:MAG: glycosyltransferase family 9 protein [Candidatus Omnitrophica bacterium]|nr:glycosyltransferase family 9 protein [Candidatus Omnitrophota bacterium]MDD5488139.1 glycosyltransferase family 9 protein [Candidatus Omnitrophota bacterium]
MDRIVIFRTDRIGEVLLSTVSIDAVKRAEPGALVSFVTSGYSKPLLDSRSDLQEVMVFEPGSHVFREAVRLAGMLRKRKFDAAIVLNPHKVLHLGCFLAGIPVRAGLSRKWGFLLTRSTADERDKGQKHEVEYTLDILATLGFHNGGNISPRLVATARGTARMLKALEKAGGGKGPFVAIHVSSSNPAKVWPAEKFARLIRSIKDKFGMDILVLGSEDEKAYVREIIEMSGPGAIDLAGVLDLDMLAALLARATVFIGNDAGPMHMAAASGVPVISIFRQDPRGAGPNRWRPWGEEHVVFHETVSGDPMCIERLGNAYKWAAEIGPDEVSDMCGELLLRKR